MEAIDIISLIAIILFARLGIRLYIRYRQTFRKEDQEKDAET
ncbi:MAG: hypothetical protein WBN13_07275 [Robiginitalea sp.]